MKNFSKEDKYLLHLCADQKFIDYEIDFFETVYPDRNIYFIEFQDKLSELKQVKSNHPNIVSGSADSPQFRELTDHISDFAAVVLHNIVNPYKLKVILESPAVVYFHWMCWGMDLYSIPTLARRTLLPETKKYLKEKSSFKDNFVRILFNNSSLLFNLFYYLKNRKRSPLSELMECFKKIGSVSTVIPPEYDIIKRYISPDILYYPFKYSTIEGFDSEGEFKICKADNLLLGNSATIENNHLDAFIRIKSIDVGNRLIYCPLSYGDSSYVSYGKHISSVGKKTFGEQFVPMTEFIPLKDYSDILDLCGNVVMYHIRQQAMGNVVMSLWKGARLFLLEENPIYGFLKEQGAIVYKISELDRIQDLPDYNTLANHNRPILKRIYSRQQVLSEALALVNILKNKGL